MMNYKILCLAFILTGCVTYPSIGKHVPIKSEQTVEEKVVLAKKVLAALPIKEVRARVQQRFPELSTKQLERIRLSYTRMRFGLGRSEDGTPIQGPPRLDVHLVMTIDVDRRLYPVRDAVTVFVASLMREELDRQQQ